jgi:3-phenylpropionate/trans-cinnamate dioxygenase ferredoxin reductase subunit
VTSSSGRRGRGSSHGDAPPRAATGRRRALESDLVVVEVGVAPRTELAEAAGLAVDDGVLVDERLVSLGRSRRRK